MATSLADEQHRLPGRRLGQLLHAVDVTRRCCDPDHGIASASSDNSVWFWDCGKGTPAYL